MTIAIVKTNMPKKQTSFAYSTSKSIIRKFEIVGLTGVFLSVKNPLKMCGF